MTNNLNHPIGCITICIYYVLLQISPVWFMVNYLKVIHIRIAVYQPIYFKYQLKILRTVFKLWHSLCKHNWKALNRCFTCCMETLVTALSLQYYSYSFWCSRSNWLHMQAFLLWHVKSLTLTWVLFTQCAELLFTLR